MFELTLAHALTFLIGVLTGTAGSYFAQKYTDIRRKKEDKSQLTKTLKKLEKLMPDLFAEMKEDISGDTTKLVNEFVIVPSKGTSFNSSKPRFVYYETEHDNLKLKIGRLLDAGVISDVSTGRAPILKMHEIFIDYLNE